MQNQQEIGPEQLQNLPPFAYNTKTTTSILLIIAQCQAFLCLISFYGFTKRDGQTCFITYRGHIRCPHKDLGMIDPDTCIKPFQCNLILSGYPMTIVMMVFVGLIQVLNCVKYKEFPKYIEKSYWISLLLLAVSMLMMFFLGFILLITDFGAHDLNIWIIMMQAFGIPFCLVASIALLRSEKIKALYPTVQPPDYIQMPEGRIARENLRVE